MFSPSLETESYHFFQFDRNLPKKIHAYSSRTLRLVVSFLLLQLDSYLQLVSLYQRACAVVQLDKRICGIVEGIIPSDRDNKEMAGAASFIPSFSD